MKNLKDRQDVAHAWAHQSYNNGKASNFWFDGPKLYSYSTCIAMILPGGAVAFTTHRYSPTTDRHMSAARMAANHMRRVYCRKPDGGVQQNKDYVEGEIAQILKSIKAPEMTKDGKKEKDNSVKQRENKQAAALHEATQFNEYLDACGEYMKKQGEKVKPIDTTKLDKFLTLLKRREAAEAAARKKEEAARLVRLQEQMVEWRKHERTHIYVYGSMPVALRLSLDRTRVETSLGAQIPVAHAKRLWRSIAATVKGEAVPETDPTLGNYKLNEIRSNGSIKVGCHDIPFNEIEGIAKELELV